MGFFDFLRPPKLQTVRAQPRPLPVQSASTLAPWGYKWDDGDKFPGGFGATELPIPDYWTLRARSWQLFETNHFARGLIFRLVSNEINTGLHLEATPEEAVLGFQPNGLAAWSELTENRFKLWANNAAICDEGERFTFGEIQFFTRLEALVAGDVLCVERQDRRTKLPRVQLIPGERVQSPLGSYKPASGNRIVHGVELDPQGRHVAYWVRQEGLTVNRLPAFGEKTGRRIAWLVYGTEKRFADVRGKPLLALFLQAFRELDRYRDATLRKAVVNSMVAAFIERDADKAPTRLVTGGAVKRGTTTTTDEPGAPRSFRWAEQIPGYVVEVGQVGEKLVPYPTSGTDMNYPEFAKAILASIAWARGLPPEILWLSFSSNYSASQAALNEFKLYLNLVREDFGKQFCNPLYVEWLLAETLSGKIKAPGLLESFRDFTQYDTFGAWISADWAGQIKPTFDMLKQAKAAEILLDLGLSTRGRLSREITGQKFSKTALQLEIENEQLARAKKPLAALEAPKVPPGSSASPDDDENEEEPEEDEDEEKAERRAS
jgi:capsid protein